MKAPLSCARRARHHVVNHRDPGYLEQVTALTGGGPNVIIEMLANQNLDHDLAILAKYGRIVIIGNRGRVEIDPRRIMGKEAAVMGMVFWNLAGDDLALVHAEMGKRICGRHADAGGVARAAASRGGAGASARHGAGRAGEDCADSVAESRAALRGRTGGRASPVGAPLGAEGQAWGLAALGSKVLGLSR